MRICTLGIKARGLLAEQSAMPTQTVQLMQVCLDLLNAETQWLLFDFERTIAATRGALVVFPACEDPAGCADMHGVLAWVSRRKEGATFAVHWNLFASKPNVQPDRFVIQAQKGVANALLQVRDPVQAQETFVAALRTAKHQGAAILDG